jgi:hypothetical protein
VRESTVLHEVRAALVGTGRVLLWRSNTGVDLARGVRYGLGVGGPDLVGCIRPTGRMLGVEVKAPEGRLSRDQKCWRDAFVAAGGAYILARSAEAALEALARIP